MTPPPPECFEEFNYFFEVTGEAESFELTFVPIIDDCADVINIEWDFGDGSANVIADCTDIIVHTFPIGGFFNVNMYVNATDSACNAYWSKTVNTNCTLQGQLLVGNTTEVRISTNTTPPVGLVYTTSEGIQICNIPDVLSGNVLMGWINLDVDCCATYPIYIEPRAAGNYSPFGTTCVRTGTNEFTYTAKHCSSNPGVDRVFTITSDLFDITYAGPYSNVPIWYNWVSGPKDNACSIDIVWYLNGCSMQDTSLLGYFLLQSSNNPC